MGRFDWLFGKKSHVRTNQAYWQTSDRGNPMMLYGGRRATVFPSDGGWKYCFAKGETDDDPHFSDPYRSEEHMKGSPMQQAVRGSKARFRMIPAPSPDLGGKRCLLRRLTNATRFPTPYH